MRPKSRNSNLSNNLLKMKFMKTSALRVENDLANEEQKQIIDIEHWYLKTANLNENRVKYRIEPSFTVFNEFSYGRQSFQGFNPEIEKLMTNNEKVIMEESSDEKDVNDTEMAEYYKDHAVKNTIRKKFMKNRPLLNNMNKIRKQRHTSDTGNDHVAVDFNENDQKIQAKKRKFIKPNLDD